jgi:hypothetical protein
MQARPEKPGRVGGLGGPADARTFIARVWPEAQEGRDPGRWARAFLREARAPAAR